MSDLIIKPSGTSANFKVQNPSGTNKITMDSDGVTTIASNTTFSGTGNNIGTATAGTLGSSVVFPAGKVLQSTKIYTSNSFSGPGFGGTYTRYLVNAAKTTMSGTVHHGTGTDLTSSNDDYLHTLTAKQSNSIFRMHLSFPVYMSTSGHGYFSTFDAWMQHSTSADSGFTQVGDGTSDSMITWYQDNRSTYGTSGQDLHRVTGFDDFYSSVSAGTTLYFNVKIIFARVSVERWSTSYVEEIAT